MNQKANPSPTFLCSLPLILNMNSTNQLSDPSLYPMNRNWYRLAENVSPLRRLLRRQPHKRLGLRHKGVIVPVLVFAVHVHKGRVEGVCPLKVVLVVDLGPDRVGGRGEIDGDCQDQQQCCHLCLQSVFIYKITVYFYLTIHHVTFSMYNC